VAVAVAVAVFAKVHRQKGCNMRSIRLNNKLALAPFLHIYTYNIFVVYGLT
jgi:hypothetical protein